MGVRIQILPRQGEGDRPQGGGGGGRRRASAETPPSSPSVGFAATSPWRGRIG